MRMGREGLSAAELVNTAAERDLSFIIKTLGEERFARNIARAIVAARSEAPIATTRALAQVIEKVVLTQRPGEMHPATRTFQALRIFVNDELGELVTALGAAERMLKPGGRLVVISFHSLEDRIVKTFIAERSRAPSPSRHQPDVARVPPSFTELTRKPLIADDEEVSRNPRARSAKLRAAERTGRGRRATATSRACCRACRRYRRRDEEALMLLRLLHIAGEDSPASVLAAADVYKIKYGGRRCSRPRRSPSCATEIRRQQDEIMAKLRAEWSEARAGPTASRSWRAAPSLAEVRPTSTQYDHLDRLLRAPGRPLVPPGTADPIGALVEITLDPAVTGQRDRAKALTDTLHWTPEAAMTAAAETTVEARALRAADHERCLIGARSTTAGELAGASRAHSCAPARPLRQQVRALLYGQAEGAWPCRRSGLAILCFAAVYGVIAGRLVLYAMTPDKPWRACASARDAVATARPDIIDRTGEVLATDVKAASLFGEPKRLIDVDEAVELLTASMPDLDAKETRDRLGNRRRGFAWLKREITPKQQQDVHKLGIPGIGFLNENKRTYPSGAETAHMIGLVNVDNQGIAGMEKWLDGSGLAALHAAGFAVDGQQEPVQLAVDLRVQHAMRDELLWARDKFKAKAAAGLVTDVRTGEILAMVSVPDYDPNNPKEALDPTRINRLTTGVF